MPGRRDGAADRPAGGRRRADGRGRIGGIRRNHLLAYSGTGFEAGLRSGLYLGLAALSAMLLAAGTAVLSAGRSRAERYRLGIDAMPDLDAFVAAFGEWVEACWFAENDRAPAQLEALLAFPADVVLVGALAILRRLLELSDPRGVAPAFGDGQRPFDGDVGAALAEHLLITGPDPARAALIRAVVTAAGSGPEARREVLVAYGPEAVEGAALECSSVLTQALANRWGVVPTNILEDF